MFTTPMAVLNRTPHYAERHDPFGQVNETYTSMGVYTMIYMIQKIESSPHHDDVSFLHDSIIILVQIRDPESAPPLC